MIGTGAWAAALLLSAAPEDAPAPPPVTVPFGELQFIPPIGQTMTYRVTTRRIGRSGTLIEFSLVYSLQWHRAGRGYRLDAILRRIESDARPEILRALTGLLQPLVGEPITYVVGNDGRVHLADPEQLWARVAARTATLGASGKAPEARQAAAMLAALPETERDKLVTADVRALIGPPEDFFRGMSSDEATVSIRTDGGQRLFAKTERAQLDADTPLQIETLWTVDTATGLVLREQRQSRIAEPGGEARTLVEERIRALAPGDPG